MQLLGYIVAIAEKNQAPFCLSKTSELKTQLSCRSFESVVFTKSYYLLVGLDLCYSYSFPQRENEQDLVSEEL